MSPPAALIETPLPEIPPESTLVEIDPMLVTLMAPDVENVFSVTGT